MSSELRPPGICIFTNFDTNFNTLIITFIRIRYWCMLSNRNFFATITLVNSSKIYRSKVRYLFRRNFYSEKYIQEYQRSYNYIRQASLAELSTDAWFVANDLIRIPILRIPLEFSPELQLLDSFLAIPLFPRESSGLGNLSEKAIVRGTFRARDAEIPKRRTTCGTRANSRSRASEDVIESHGGGLLAATRGHNERPDVLRTWERHRTK